MERKISEDVKKKGYVIFQKNKVKKEIETDKRIHFLVRGETEEHSVIFDKMKDDYQCDCRYSSLAKGICSHVFACKLLEGKEKFEI